MSRKKPGAGTVYLRGKIWWIQIFRNGLAIQKSSGADDREQAEAMLAEALLAADAESAVTSLSHARESLPPAGFGRGRCLVGAAAELLVAVDLMNRGYHVFRSLGQHSPFDIIAVTESQLIRVEVKSGKKPVHVIKGKKLLHDVLATATPGGVFYRPGPAEWTKFKSTGT